MKWDRLCKMPSTLPTNSEKFKFPLLFFVWPYIHSYPCIELSASKILNCRLSLSNHSLLSFEFTYHIYSPNSYKDLITYFFHFPSDPLIPFPVTFFSLLGTVPMSKCSPQHAAPCAPFLCCSSAPLTLSSFDFGSPSHLPSPSLPRTDTFSKSVFYYISENILTDRFVPLISLFFCLL